MPSCAGRRPPALSPPMMRCPLAKTWRAWRQQSRGRSRSFRPAWKRLAQAARLREYVCPLCMNAALMVLGVSCA